MGAGRTIRRLVLSRTYNVRYERMDTRLEAISPGSATDPPRSLRSTARTSGNLSPRPVTEQCNCPSSLFRRCTTAPRPPSAAARRAATRYRVRQPPSKARMLRKRLQHWSARHAAAAPKPQQRKGPPWGARTSSPPRPPLDHHARSDAGRSTLAQTHTHAHTHAHTHRVGRAPTRAAGAGSDAAHSQRHAGLRRRGRRGVAASRPCRKIRMIKLYIGSFPT